MTSTPLTYAEFNRYIYDKIEVPLKRYAKTPILGMAPAIIRVGGGVIQLISALAIAVLATPFSLCSGTAANFRNYAFEHILHGFLNIVSGTVQIIPFAYHLCLCQSGHFGYSTIREVEKRDKISVIEAQQASEAASGLSSTAREKLRSTYSSQEMEFLTVKDTQKPYKNILLINPRETLQIDSYRRDFQVKNGKVRIILPNPYRFNEHFQDSWKRCVDAEIDRCQKLVEKGLICPDTRRVYVNFDDESVLETYTSESYESLAKEKGIYVLHNQGSGYSSYKETLLERDNRENLEKWDELVLPELITDIAKIIVHHIPIDADSTHFAVVEQHGEKHVRYFGVGFSPHPPSSTEESITSTILKQLQRAVIDADDSSLQKMLVERYLPQVRAKMEELAQKSLT